MGIISSNKLYRSIESVNEFGETSLNMIGLENWPVKVKNTRARSWGGIIARSIDCRLYLCDAFYVLETFLETFGDNYMSYKYLWIKVLTREGVGWIGVETENKFFIKYREV